MKRNFELIRELLLDIEENAKIGNWYFPKLSNYSDDDINYHLRLMEEVNYLILRNLSSKSGDSFAVLEIRMAGHDYLDAIRNNTVWKKTKKTILDKAGSLSFDLIKSVSSEIIKGMMS